MSTSSSCKAGNCLMKTRNLIASLAVGLFVLAPCGCNAVYFYETGKASLTLEARPDPTSPLSGSLGLKHRIAAIVPSTQPSTPESRDLKKKAREKEAEAAELAVGTDEEGSDQAQSAKLRDKARSLVKAAETLDAKGNALSVLSSFRFHLYPVEKGRVVPRVTLDAALITGHAAQSVSRGRLAQTVGALSGVESDEAVQLQFAAFSQLYEALRQQAEADPKSAAAKSKAELDAIALALPSTYPVDVYAQSTPPNLQVRQRKGAPVQRKTFDDVAKYAGLLADSKEALDRTIPRITPDAPITIGDKTVGGPGRNAEADQKELAATLQDTRAALGALREQLSATRLVFGIEP